MILAHKMRAVLLLAILFGGIAGTCAAEGGARIIVFPPANEYIHPTTNRIEKWVGTFWQEFNIKTLRVRLEANYHLTGDWPEDAGKYRWAVGVMDYNLFLRWPNNTPFGIWYHKQRDVLLSNHTKIPDFHVCNCTYGNSLGFEYVW